jgi:outer membrane protein assembly factor BamA
VRAQLPTCLAKKLPYPTFAEEIRQANGIRPDFKIVVSDFKFKGSVHDAEVVRARILKEIQEWEFHGDELEWHDQVAEDIVRGDFQNRGYFEVQVDGVELQPLDPTDPQHRVVVIASVNEGENFSTGDISFVNADPEKALEMPEPELRGQLSLAKGDPLNVDEIRKGIMQMSRLYGARGFIDATVEPNFSIDRKRHVIDITMRVSEGREYHVEKFSVRGLSATATTLLESKMQPGSKFDNHLLEELFKIGKTSSSTSASLLDVARINRNVETGTVDIEFDFSLCPPLKN